MSNWTADELRRLGDADELSLASRRPDGTLRPFITIWGVRAGSEVYVRSAYGPGNPWYRRALSSGGGRVRGGGAERDVLFEAADADVQNAIDAAYHAKYDRYGPRIVATVTGPRSHEVTLRLVPVGDD